MINIKNITINYGKKNAIENFTYEFAEGKIFAIIGKNGCGKSTLLKAIMSILKLSSGNIYVNNIDISSSILYKKNIGYVPENIYLFEKFTGFEYLSFIGRFRGINNLKFKILELAKLSEISYLLDQTISTYSKGTKQKLVFIGAIIHNPKILILDEPFDGMDQLTVLKYIDFLKFFAKNGGTVIFTSHDENVISNLSDKIIVLNEGKILNVFKSNELNLEEIFNFLSREDTNALRDDNFGVAIFNEINKN